jgi:hypothetical protein
MTIPIAIGTLCQKNNENEHRKIRMGNLQFGSYH